VKIHRPGPKDSDLHHRNSSPDRANPGRFREWRTAPRSTRTHAVQTFMTHPGYRLLRKRVLSTSAERGCPRETKVSATACAKTSPYRTSAGNRRHYTHLAPVGRRVSPRQPTIGITNVNPKQGEYPFGDRKMPTGRCHVVVAQKVGEHAFRLHFDGHHSSVGPGLKLLVPGVRRTLAANNPLIGLTTRGSGSLCRSTSCADA
jgi:hypothetical protein